LPEFWLYCYLSNPEFDKELSESAQVAEGDLPAESGGMLRGMEEREIADLSFVDLLICRIRRKCDNANHGRSNAKKASWDGWSTSGKASRFTSLVTRAMAQTKSDRDSGEGGRVYTLDSAEKPRVFSTLKKFVFR
jgi:hypothetical protein